MRRGLSGLCGNARAKDRGGTRLATLLAGMLVLTGVVALTGPRSDGPGEAAGRIEPSTAQVTQQYGALPMAFEVNTGQTDPAVGFLSRGNGYNLFLTPTEAVMSLRTATVDAQVPGGDRAPATPVDQVVRMQLRGSNGGARPVHGRALDGKVNYLVGSDRTQWRTNLPLVAEAGYDAVYPGIDVRYHGTQGQLEYDFLIAPGADPRVIRMAIAGADGLSITPQGDLAIATPGGELRQAKPVVFQDVAGQRRPVDGSFVLLGDREVGFRLGAYDATLPLVIDPTLSYSTYLGGTANDFGFGIAVDSSGNAYLGGQTGSATFPRGGAGDPNPKGATPGAPQTTFKGGTDAFILKLNAAGNALVYATYLGGARGDAGWDLEIDASGNAYLAGSTESADDPGTTAAEAGFPTTDGTNGTVAAFDNTCGTDGLCNNVLPANFFAPACDPLTPGCDPGNPSSPGFLPALCPPATFPNGCATPPGPADNFLAKLSPAGDKLLYSTVFGGSSFEQNPDEVPYAGQMGLALFGTRAYIHSTTFSEDFPVHWKAFQKACASCADGANDGYLTVLDTAVGGANGLVYSTYIGGSGFDEGKAVAVDEVGDAYVTGVITGVDPTPGSTTFPVKRPMGGSYLGSGAYSGATYHGGYTDAYISKITPVGRNPAATLVWSSFLGGGGKEEGWGVAVKNTAGGPQPVVAGYTSSGANPHPQVADPAHPGACSAAPNPATGIRPFCDYATDPVPYFPITPGAAQTTFAGRVTTDSGSTLFLDGDAFVVKLPRDGSALTYSTFFGGPNADYAQGLALDSRSNVYITGWTTCRSQDPAGTGGILDPPPQFDFDGVPTGRNPGEPAATGVGDCPIGMQSVNAPPGLDTLNSTNIDNHINDSPTGAFVTKFSADLSTVEYNVLLDGRGFDRGFTVAVRSVRRTARQGGDANEVYVSGRTGNASNIAGCVPSCAFPLTPGSYDTTYNGSGRDAFITKLIG